MPGPGRASSFYHIVNMNKGKKNKENDPENSTRDEVFEEFEIPDNEPVFTVSVVSRLLDIPVWVLKKLDSEEIVCPKRSRGNDRLYSKKNVSSFKQNRLNSNKSLQNCSLATAETDDRQSSCGLIFLKLKLSRLTRKLNTFKQKRRNSVRVLKSMSAPRPTPGNPG